MTFHVKHLGWALFLALGSACAQERVSVPSPTVELVATIYRPPGAGPFPAIVMLHGCSGLWRRDGRPTASYDFWARHFRGRGFVAVLLDSFGPRGEREICTHQERAIRPERERVTDAYAALEWLAKDPGVDGERVFLLGWSNGGTTALHAAARSRAPGAPRFAAAVAFYPGCGPWSKGSGYQPAMPVLIQAGGADDWTPAAACVALAAAARGAVEIDVYEGAHHAFDRVEGRVRHRADVRNRASPTGRGATVGPHPEAREKSLERTTAYLQAAARAVPRGTKGRDGPGLP